MALPGNPWPVVMALSLRYRGHETFSEGYTLTTNNRKRN